MEISFADMLRHNRECYDVIVGCGIRVFFLFLFLNALGVKRVDVLFANSFLIGWDI